MSTVLASAADRRYGLWLLNLVGSVEANTRGAFDAIVLYDLGLSPFQRRLAASIRGVELRTVPEFVPHWREGRAWKTWIWRHLEADRIVWLDAGATVLRPLDEALAQIDERGYWVVSQGHPVEDVVPSDYYALYDFPRALGTRPVIAAGILGFARRGTFFERVVVPTYDDAVAGRSRGASADEVWKYDYGMERMTEVIIRDCRRFRHEQTLLNIHFYRSIDDPVVNDLERWAGSRSPREHPRQVIWGHRRRGDFRYIARVPYRLPTALFGVPFGLAFRVRWWVRLHRWLLRPSTYLGRARRLVAGLRRRARAG
jgi:hypothetical protein